MSKKRKKKSTKKLSAKALRDQLTQLFSLDPKIKFNQKEILEILDVSNSRDSIQHALDTLASNKIIVKLSSGKYKLEEFGGNRPNLSNDKKSKGASQISSGIVDLTRTGAAYIVCDDNSTEKDIYVSASKMLNALNGDRVSVRWNLSRRGKPEGEILRVLQRQREQFMGTLIVARQSCFVLPDDQNLLVDIMVSEKQLGKAKHGDKVLVGISQWHSPKGLPSPMGEIRMILGQSGTSNVEMQSILIRHGFNIAFPEDALSENEAIPEQIPQSEVDKRLDMRGITTFTIDPDTAKDFDDALSLRKLENGNYEIGVHIADVSHYVTEGSALDKEALHRTTSVYLVDRVCPMLPEKLSNGVCSLRPHEDKLTFSALFEFSQKGDLLSEWFGKTVIRSDHRFTYGAAQAVLESGEGEYAKELRLLNTFAHKMRNERFKKGAMRFESPEVKFKLDEQGNPVGVYLKERKDAHMLIEDFMLLANKRVAAFLYNLPKEGKDIVPFVYRIHDTPDMDKVAEFSDFARDLGYELKIKNAKQVSKSFATMLNKAAGTAEFAVLQQLAIRTMAKAAYSTDNIGHYGLAFENYSHFTSPIRRYADVLVHRILHKYLQTGKRAIKKEALQEHCNRISKIERKAMEAERESIKYKQVQYLEKCVGDVFEGTISGITDRGIYVEIVSNHCEGLVRFDQMYDTFVLVGNGMYIRSADRVYKMGDPVWIKVINTDLKKRHVDMELLDDRLMEQVPEEVATVTKKQVAAPKKAKTKNEKKPKAPAPKAEKKPAKEQKAKTAKTSTKEVKKEAPKPKTTKASNPNKGQLDQEAFFSSLVEETKTNFERSAINKYAKRYKKIWNYQISPTALHRRELMVLNFNWLANANTNYEAQSQVGNASILEAENGSLKAMKPFIEQYLPKVNLNKTSWSALSCFRSKAENQISEQDLELGVPVFERFLQYIQPKVILSFSNQVREYFETMNILLNYEEHKIQVGKNELVVAKGILKQAYGNIKVYFLPHPKKRLATAKRKQAWEWAF